MMPPLRNMCSCSKPIWRISLALLLLGCPGPGTGPVQVRPVENPPLVDLSLGPADIFEVRVYGEAELSSTYRVSPEGEIDFPLIGRVAVKGLSAAEVAQTISERLKSYVKQPQVSVFVREVHSKRIAIYGQVQHPGTQGFAEGMTLVQAVSAAGGLTAMAARDRVRVTRVQAGQSSSLTVNLKDIADGKVTFYLLPGDEVFVPERVF